MGGDILVSVVIQALFLPLLRTENRNDGQKGLFERQTWSSRDVVIAIVLCNALTVVAYLLILEFKSSRLFFEEYRYLAPLLLTFIIALICTLRCQRGVIDLGFRTRGEITVVAALLGVGSLLFIVASLILLSPNEPSKWGVPGKYLYYAQYGFAGIIVAPLAEEGIFRGILYSVYRKKYGVRWAIVITSIMFAAAHPGTIAIPQFVVGIICGIVYERTESLIRSASFHGIVNATAFAAMVASSQVSIPGMLRVG